MKCSRQLKKLSAEIDSRGGRNALGAHHRVPRVCSAAYRTTIPDLLGAKRQRELAAQLGVDPFTITNGELSTNFLVDYLTLPASVASGTSANLPVATSYI